MLEESLLLFSSVSALLFSLITALIILRVRNRAAARSQTTRLRTLENDSGNRALVLSTADTKVRSAESDAHNKLSSLLQNLGYTVTFIQDITELRKTLSFAPAVFAVDFGLKRGIVRHVEKLCKLPFLDIDMPVVFYNVPDPDDVSPGTVLTNAVFLGTSFTDRNIIRAIMSSVQRNSEQITDDVFLRGRITGEGLFEVFQLIELGRKTGILIIHDEVGTKTGTISFKNGAITYAECDCPEPLDGTDAVLNLLSVKSGGFDFVLDRAYEQENCQLSPTEIMMLWTKDYDEQQRDYQPPLKARAS